MLRLTPHPGPLPIRGEGEEAVGVIQGCGSSDGQMLRRRPAEDSQPYQCE